MTESPLPRLRWLMIGLAFLATVINYLDRQALSVAAPVLRDEFQISNIGYSRVVFAFMLSYTIMNGASGPLLDRLGTRIGYAVCMLWWSGAALLHAFTSGVWSLAAFRFLLGMGEAGNWPAAVKVVAEWFPVRERALAAGIFNSGSSVGAIITPPIVAWIILSAGWRPVFYVVGGAGLLWLIAWVCLYRTPAVAHPEETAVKVPIRHLLRHRFVWMFMLSKVFMDPVWYFYTFWFPEYLKRARNFDMAAIGRYAWIPFLAAGFGNVLGGWVSAACLRRGISLTITRKSCVTLFAILMTAAIPAVLTSKTSISIAWVSVAMIGYTGSLANMLSLPADVFPSNAVGSVYGFASMGSGIGGMLFGLLTGWAVDHYSYTPVFIGFGVMPLVCAAILWTLLGPITPLTAEKGLEPKYAG